MRVVRVAGLPVIARRPRCSRTETLGRDVPLCNWMSSSSRPCTRGCVIRVQEEWVAGSSGACGASVSGGVLSPPFLLSGDAGPLAGGGACLACGGCRVRPAMWLPCSRFRAVGHCRRHGERCLHRGNGGSSCIRLSSGGADWAVHRDRAGARGGQVTVIDRDPGPDGGRWWDRKGVMQFHHPHFFRQQVAEALLAEMPEVWAGLLAAGAVPAVLPGQPGVPAGLHCRRVTFERVLREAASTEPGACAPAMPMRCAPSGDASPGSGQAAVRSMPTWSSTRAAGPGG